MADRILFVDDDTNLLAAMRRQLGKRFAVDTAPGPQEALKALHGSATADLACGGKGPYAVVVSDLRMPGMDGIRFLAEARRQAPDTVRVMLTGNADLAAAVEAVNEDNVFRFLTKPVAPEDLTRALEASVRQYRLVTAERELLEKTLSGSLQVVTDLLALASPRVFSRASRVSRYVGQMAKALGLAEVWELEVAAMLSQIGSVALMPDTIGKVYAGEELPPEEAELFAAHPGVGRDLLRRIPRLQTAAEIIGKQNGPFGPADFAGPPAGRDRIAVGAQVLKTAMDFDRMLMQGMLRDKAVARLRERPQEYDPLLVAALDHVDVTTQEAALLSLRVEQLDARMVLDQDVHSKSGLLLVSEGQEITLVLRQRLQHWAEGVGVAEPVRVLVPLGAIQQWIARISSRRDEQPAEAAPAPGT